MSRDSSATRARILDCTCNLLESGDKKVRMADVAKAVGVSRQALYLHFPTRAELLIATTRHIDSVKNVDARLAESRAATSGRERLEAFISAWGGYIPEIHGVSVALRSMYDNDAEAEEAWNDRMQAVRHGCVAAVAALASDKMLRPDLNVEVATDLLWTLLSVENWERLVRDCGWSQAEYESHIKRLSEAALLAKD